MAKVKGSGKEMLLRTLRKFGPDKEKLFLESLTPVQRANQDQVTSIHWVELEMDERENSLYKAAQVLFPGDLMKMRKFGETMAEHGFATVYKMFMAIPTLTYIFKRVAAQWSQLYDTGTATVEDIKDHSAVLVVRNFPDMPVYLREYLTGFYSGMGRINGVKNMRVRQIGINPNEWKWKLEWD